MLVSSIKEENEVLNPLAIFHRVAIVGLDSSRSIWPSIALLTPVFDGLLTDYNAIIATDVPIQTGFSDVENQRRYWEIEGFSKVACGGTHVKSTAEVGYVTLKRVNIGGGKERIEIKLIDQPSHSTPL